MSLSHSVLIVAVAAACTYLLRAAAFVLFSGKKQLPKSIDYLGRVLPPAIIAILVVYCLKSIDLTAAPHGLPEVLFSGKKQLPKSIDYLGRVLPPAIIAILVVYCLKSIDLTAAPHGLPELLAVCAVAALHLWKRSNLLSIGAGTVFYMFLVQVVFA